MTLARFLKAFLPFGFCILYGLSLWACPCGAGYKYYYLITNSGSDRGQVISQAKKLSEGLGHTFSFEGKTLEERIKGCGRDPAECLVLLTSDDEPIGKSGWTTGMPDTVKKTFAAVYVFQSYDTNKNKKSAETLKAKIKNQVKDAYLKAMDACACE